MLNQRILEPTPSHADIEQNSPSAAQNDHCGRYSRRPPWPPRTGTDLFNYTRVGVGHLAGVDVAHKGQPVTKFSFEFADIHVGLGFQRLQTVDTGVNQRRDQLVNIAVGVIDHRNVQAVEVVTE